MTRKTRDVGFVCGPDLTPVEDIASKCPDRAKHTPRPEGYSAWHEWAGKMMRTHRQTRCHSCGLLAIWVPRLVNDRPRVGA